MTNSKKKKDKKTKTERDRLKKLAKDKANEKNLASIKNLKIVSCICILFMTAEVIGGALANSLAIMTDAAHLLSDLLGFVLSIFALKIGMNKETETLSFGYQRAEVIGALTSIVLIWGLTLWLIYEAIVRVIMKPPVDGQIMLITAVIGLFCNIIMMMTLKAAGVGHSHGGGAMHGGHDDSHGGGPGGHKAHGPNAQHLKDHGGGSHGDKPCEGHDNYDELDDKK